MKTYINKIIGFSVLASTCFYMSSCEDDRLDLLPTDQINSELVTTEVQLDGVIKGMYAEAADATAFGSRITILGDLISDNTFVSDVQNSGRYLTTNTISWTFENSDNEFGQMRSLNGIIGMANIALNANITEFTSEQTVNDLKGQAHIARGLSYFYLVNLYGSNPTSGLHQEFGVPIYTGVYDATYSGPRNTVDEVYEQVISDLTTAVSIMSNNQPLNKGYLSKAAAHLILSRVYLTRGKPGDYQLAIDHANQLITTPPPGFGFLINVDQPEDVPEVNEYAQYFSSTQNSISENQPETVWEINMTSAAGSNPGVNEALGSFYANTGSIFFKQDFKATFPTSDYRSELLSGNGPNGDTPRGVILRKWPRATADEGQFTINVKVLRMSEAKLNKIEAMYHLGQTAEALTLLNEFATQRGGSTYSGTDLLNDILTERRKEFFGEGQRFFDLKRNNLPLIKTTNCMMNCEKPANDRIFTFPMPLQEMNLNTLMVQHPQWQ